MSRFFSDSGQKLRNLRIWRREGGSHWRDREGCHTRAMGVRRRHRTGAGWAPATAALLMAACVRGRFCNESEPLMPYEVRREWRGCLQLFNNESGWARHHMKMQHRTMLIGNNPLIANVTWSWVTYSSGLMLKRWTARYTDAWGDLREMDIDLSQWKNWFTIRETDDWLSKSIQSFIPYDNELCNSIHKGLDFCPRACRYLSAAGRLSRAKFQCLAMCASATMTRIARTPRGSASCARTANTKRQSQGFSGNKTKMSAEAAVLAPARRPSAGTVRPGSTERAGQDGRCLETRIIMEELHTMRWSTITGRGSTSNAISVQWPKCRRGARPIVRRLAR